ncbi:MAG: hypothetical protein IJI53_01850 [Clostridia bacterium]|nr:hypothetical protein [Clostridia bacterium]
MAEYIDEIRLNGESIPIRDSDAQEKIAQWALFSGANGIASAVMNADYTLTLTFTDGTAYTTPSIRGVSGADGQGVPAGGNAGQYLRKRSASNYDAEWGALPKAVTVNFGTVSSLPVTKNAPGVTADMVVASHEFGTPSAFTSGLSVTTGNGAVTLSGTMNGSSTVRITFVSADQVTGT